MFYLLIQPSAADGRWTAKVFSFGPFDSAKDAGRFGLRNFPEMWVGCSVLETEIYPATETGVINAKAGISPVGPEDDLPLDSPAFMNASPVVQKEILRLQEKVASLTA